MTAEEMQKLGNHSVEMAMSSLSSWTKNAQAIALEVADYSQKSFAGAAWEKLMDAKSLEKAMEVQGDYLKSSYEDFVAQTAKVSELCAGLAKDACKPLEDVLAKTSMTK